MPARCSTVARASEPYRSTSGTPTRGSRCSAGTNVPVGSPQVRCRDSPRGSALAWAGGLSRALGAGAVDRSRCGREWGGRRSGSRRRSRLSSSSCLVTANGPVACAQRCRARRPISCRGPDEGRGMEAADEAGLGRQVEVVEEARVPRPRRVGRARRRSRSKPGVRECCVRRGAGRSARRSREPRHAGGASLRLASHGDTGGAIEALGPLARYDARCAWEEEFVRRAGEMRGRLSPTVEQRKHFIGSRRGGRTPFVHLGSTRGRRWPELDGVHGVQRSLTTAPAGGVSGPGTWLTASIRWSAVEGNRGPAP
jgi:hypothetical protein